MDSSLCRKSKRAGHADILMYPDLKKEDTIITTLQYFTFVLFLEKFYLQKILIQIELMNTFKMILAGTPTFDARRCEVMRDLIGRQ